jgi:putative ABC transport system permease protein
METLLQDIRYAARTLLKSPAFTATAVLTLALGIGANTAIFSVVEGVLLRSLPYRAPGQLVMAWENHPQEGAPRSPFSPANYADLRAQTGSFESFGAIYPYSTVNLTGLGEPEELRLLRVDAGLFPTLGVGARLGRTLVAEDDRPGGPNVVVISDGFWRSRFGADTGAVGRSVTLGGEPYTIVGVMPPGFALPTWSGDLIAPLGLDEQTAQLRAVRFLTLVGRLKPGVTLPQVTGELATIAGRIAAAHPETNAGVGITVLPVQQAVVGDVRPALLVLLGAVAFVLLIACANVANLLLARAAGRGREMAVRVALGAGRRRIVRQLLTESILLAALGALGGIALAAWGIEWLRQVGAVDVPRIAETGLRWPVLLFAGATALATGVAVGVVPALHAIRPQLSGALNEGARGSSSGPERRRARSVLLVSQVAMVLVLLIGAGLMLRTLRRLLAVNPGVQVDRAVTLGVRVGGPRYQSPMATIGFYDHLTEQLAALPGVRAVGAVNVLPFGASGPTTGLRFESRPPGEGPPPEAEYRSVTPGYFAAIGIPLVAGRGFEPRDRSDSTLPTLVSETFARRYFPGDTPLGRRVRLGPNPNAPWRTIVGVVGDVRDLGLGAPPRPDVYVLFTQSPSAAMSLVLRAAGNPATVVAPARAVIRTLDPDVPVSNVATLRQLVGGSVARTRYAGSLLAGFAALALVIAVVGIYGVMSYLVTQRSRELGVRIALGARPADILRLVLRDGVRLATLGAGLGVLAALGATRAMVKLLYDVSPVDPMTYAAVSLLLVAIVLVACVIPARRAARVDPMVVLRTE